MPGTPDRKSRPYLLPYRRRVPAPASYGKQFGDEAPIWPVGTGERFQSYVNPEDFLPQRLKPIALCISNAGLKACSTCTKSIRR
jgi:hypothetical protein